MLCTVMAFYRMKGWSSKGKRGLPSTTFLLGPEVRKQFAIEESEIGVLGSGQQLTNDSHGIMEVSQRDAGYNLCFHNMWQIRLKLKGVLVNIEGDAWIV